INRIKIDRSFVIKVDEDPDQAEMLSTILLMAKQLKMETLAEGVETQGEMDTLEKMGCKHIQGYGIAKPMPLQDLQPWLVARPQPSLKQVLTAKTA
ncbi:MAG: EAL domain-containing protein, partial [Planktomarina sp.]